MSGKYLGPIVYSLGTSAFVGGGFYAVRQDGLGLAAGVVSGIATFAGIMINQAFTMQRENQLEQRIAELENRNSIPVQVVQSPPPKNIRSLVIDIGIGDQDRIQN